VADSSLAKGARVLEALCRDARPTRLSDLAAALGLQKSTAHRVLGALVDLGFVTQDATTGLYAASLKTWELGTAVAAAVPVRQAAAHVLLDLHRQTGETVNLTVPDGDDVLFLDKLVSPRPVRFTVRVGSRVPAPFTAGGKAMLALGDDAVGVVERVAQRSPAGMLDVPAVLRDIDRARRRGYAVSTLRVGVVSVAAAVPGPDGPAVAALSVSAPEERLDAGRRAAIVEAVRAAASHVAEAVGA